MTRVVEPIAYDFRFHIDRDFTYQVLFYYRHDAYNGRRLYRPYPFERSGGDAHERYEHFLIVDYRVGNSFTKEITALSR